MSTLTNLQAIESYTSEHYAPSQNHLRELWFMCHAQGFSYAIFDGYQKQVLEYHSFEVADFFIISPETLRGLLNNIDVFLNDFKSVKIIFENTFYTLLPAALFEEEEAATYYQLKYELQDGMQLLNQRIPDFGAQIVYAVPQFMLNELLSKFTDSSIRERVKVFHHAQALLSSLYYQTAHLNKEVCYLNLGEKSFDIVMIKNSNLHFCNSYPYHNPEDVLYFVMHTYQSHQLKPEICECCFSGSNPQESKIKEIVNTYIKNTHDVVISQVPASVQHPSTLFLLQHCV